MIATRVLLDSTALTAVSFSPKRNVLEVEFRNGLIYEYLGVSPSLYEQLLTASSKGPFLPRPVHPKLLPVPASRRIPG